MKIYNRTEFMKLPEGTAFCKGKPWYWSGVNFKGETIESNGENIDWFYFDPYWVNAHDSGEATTWFEEMQRTNASYPIEEAEGRDGCFDNEDLFLIFEKADLETFKQHIETAISVSR